MTALRGEGLSQGEPLVALADEFGVSENTLRTQLHHALEKTGTDRQADLIRLVPSAFPPLASATTDRAHGPALRRPLGAELD